MKYFAPLLLALATLLVVTPGCNEEKLLDLDNPNELSSATYYQTGDQALAAVNVIYNSFQTTDLYRRRYFFMHDILSGEATGLGSLAGDMVQLQQRTFDGANPAINEVWRGLYRGIHRANLVLENVPNTEDDITEAERQRYLGEARFLRAWFYFELVSLFGDVPLMTTPANADVVEGIGRAPASEVYDLILSDLDQAEQLLPLKSAYDAADAGRATQGAAQALKGKVHLFRGNYAEAASELQKVVDSGEYALVDDYFDNFKEETENNPESVFEVQFGNTTGGDWNPTGGGNSEVTFRGQEYGFKEWRNVVPSQRLLDEFEDGDPRFAFSFYSPCDTYNQGQDVIYTPNDCPPPDDLNPTTPDDLASWRKYQQHYRQPSDNTRSPINFRTIRYADVLLMLAEARAETESITEALDLVNQVRRRPSVNMQEYPTAEYPFDSREEAIRAIYHERIVELSGEQVWYRDLLRRPELFYQDWVPTAELPKHLLLPIPQTEIDNNESISNANQNPGY